ncbi:hypothetical protein [Cupriavidus lacunae]|uniref:hypothetical protein n=1 Tax=Cupriavidus lacunae TaxID=2666307 RepID=UPI001058D697|nr:hypothetical protein [Cupriavidus lacunae]
MTRLVAAILFLCFGLAQAAPSIVSCDGLYVAKVDGAGVLVIDRSSRRFVSRRMDHNVSGGVFSLDNSLLILFGAPIAIDPNVPQVTRLSIIRIKRRPLVIMRQLYGGGVYDASFSLDQNFVSVENQFGVDVLDLAHKASKMLTPGDKVGFSTQECPVR